MTTTDGTMTYEEFEWHILRLVYEEGLQRLEPSYLAYALGLPHDQVTEFLDEAASSGLLEMEVAGDGRIEYSVPGFDDARDLPSPIWKDIEEEFDLERPADVDDDPRPGGDRDRSAADGGPAGDIGAEPPPEAERPPAAGGDQTPPSRRGDAPTDQPPAATDGAVGSDPPPRRQRQRPEETADPERRLDVAKHPQLPSSIRQHIEARYSQAEGSMVPFEDQSPIVGTEASVDDPTSRTVSALDDNDNFPFRIETTDDTYCDPTQTVFMRQIRVHGVDSEEELRHHVQRLFESFGYRIVQAEDDRLRFERGSVTFILALVPLFVLVLPLFVYLFLYCMGRSTIHQEPVELDVQFRRQIEDGEPVYEIDLTFIGLHGVVLGAADQRVLNQEIDTLRDELRWSLSPG